MSCTYRDEQVWFNIDLTIIVFLCIIIIILLFVSCYGAVLVWNVWLFVVGVARNVGAMGTEREVWCHQMQAGPHVHMNRKIRDCVISDNRSGLKFHNHWHPISITLGRGRTYYSTSSWHIRRFHFGCLLTKSNLRFGNHFLLVSWSPIIVPSWQRIKDFLPECWNFQKLWIKMVEAGVMLK